MEDLQQQHCFYLHDPLLRHGHFARTGDLSIESLSNFFTHSTYLQYSLGKLDGGSQSLIKLGALTNQKLDFSDIEVSFKDVVVTTDEFRTISPERRKCLFRDERKLRHFPAYAEANCLLVGQKCISESLMHRKICVLQLDLFQECSWDGAERECGCVPWYLRDNFPKSQLCEYVGNECFAQVVRMRHSSPRKGYPIYNFNKQKFVPQAQPSARASIPAVSAGC